MTSERRPPALEPKEVLERYPHATFPEKVAVGQEEKLEVIIRAQRRAEEGPSIRVLATPEEREVPVLVLVKPGSFEIRGEDRQEIRLPVESRDSKTATFRLVAREKGRQAIRVLFFPRGVYAAEIEVKTNVVSKAAEAAGAARPSVRSEAPISEIPPSADLTMIISEEKRDPGLVYDVCLYSPRLGLIWGKFGKVGLSTDPESKFREIFRDMEDDSLPAAVIERNVIAKGKSLYSELFPQELKEEYWRIRDRIDSIVVVTEEPWIPWEILKPYRGTDGGFQDDPFLCERYSFTRWLTGPTYRPKARIERAKIVVPTDTDLWNVIPERDWIEAFGRQKDFQVTFASELEEVLESLKRGEFDLLHFSSHGRFDPAYPNTSGVTLQGGVELRPEHLTGLADLAKTNPLVILNACQTGSQGFSLTRIGGWASAFLNAHASGFLGTQWSISDVVAFAFTKEFYQRLAQGTPLGKAVQQARTACLRPGDPSALAYQLYAYPNSIMKLGT